MPDREPRRPGLTKDGALVADLLKLLLKIRAKEIDVAPQLIARSDDLEALAAGVRKDLTILEGWRFEEFGRDALDLVEGRLAFAIENGKLKMSRRRERSPSMRSVVALVSLALAACSTASAEGPEPLSGAGTVPRRRPGSVRRAGCNFRHRRRIGSPVRCPGTSLGTEQGR